MCYVGGSGGWCINMWNLNIGTCHHIDKTWNVNIGTCHLIDNNLQYFGIAWHCFLFNTWSVFCAILVLYLLYCSFNWFIILKATYMFAIVRDLSICKGLTLILFFQDKELRYRFIYNHFPSLQEEVMIIVEVLIASSYD